MKKYGLTTVFANGCFDILHVGHVRLLQFARKQGDRLIVGLNSDDSIRRLKGDKRPIFDQDTRAAVLLALRCVDDVFIFDEDTPHRLICDLKPDILVKGDEYAGKCIVGERSMRNWGGIVVFAPMVEGVSTTKTIERMSQP